MKTTIAMAVLALTAMAGMTAEARLGTPVWSCEIKAELQNNSWALGIGYVNKSGPARITCSSLEGGITHQNAFVQIAGPALGLDLNFTNREKVYMATGKIAVRDASELYGQRTLSLGANANLLLVGAGAAVGVEFGDKLIGLNPSASVSMEQGLEATVSLQQMTISPR